MGMNNVAKAVAVNASHLICDARLASELMR